MASASEAQSKSTRKRDRLVAIQEEAQALWDESHAFELDAPADASAPKFLGTFPYPYMNGLLHLGHVFTLTRVEFAVSYERLKGRNALFPFGLHCTGAPIKSAASKLARELEQYGCPPRFPTAEEIAAAEAEAAADVPSAAAAAAAGAPTDPTRFRSKKSKAVSKGSGAYQWNILASMGIPEEEIPRFKDPRHWLEYFPPQAVADLRQLGAKIDWRRSFITTDVNPYYDAFVQWQFRKLRALGKVQLGTRYAIWSPLDNEPCLDHDRATGEGVVPQEYTAIKMRLLEPYPEVLAPLREQDSRGAGIFFVAATLRPETMYGQTNFFVLPEGEYAAVRVKDGSILLLTERVARNLSYQGFTETRGEYEVLCTFRGADVMGCAVRSPLARYERIHCFPMFNILMDKGTGVVTSVPSDSPDDYAAVSDLRKKPALRDKYKLSESMLLDLVPIIEIPDWGNSAGPLACEKFNVQSQNDQKALGEAKKAVYKHGFYEGTLIIGPYSGEKVKDVKNRVRDELVAAGDAFTYAEPEKPVTARTGDDCVVALSEQWFITYGEQEWMEAGQRCLAQLETFHPETRAQLDYTLGWLKGWACAREFGLGSRLPFDTRYLIESLSDSTIYMAFYTVAHMLQGNLNGSVPGSAGIPASALTDAVWDYVFLEGPLPADCAIPGDVLAKMRHEFTYWYPVDLRVSGKDLIRNHLTMFMYNHVAIFPEKHWPRGIRCNGHILLNNEKMSKQTGNFLTLRDGIEKFSADGLRLALAAAGDGVDDANFEEQVANKCVLRLYKLLDWAEEVCAESASFRSGDSSSLFDRVFESDMNRLIAATDEAYSKMQYCAALNFGFFEFSGIRETYRLATAEIGMHRGLVMRYLEAQTVLIAPFAPHVAEKLWRIMGKSGRAIDARFPVPSGAGVDASALAAREYLDGLVHALATRVAPKKVRPGQPDKFDGVRIYVADKLPEWKSRTLVALRKRFDECYGDLGADKDVAAYLRECDGLKGLNKREFGLVMPFYTAVVRPQLAKRGVAALDMKLLFDEVTVVREQIPYIKALIHVKEITVVGPAEDDPFGFDKRASAVPAEPAIDVYVVGGAAASSTS